MKKITKRALPTFKTILIFILASISLYLAYRLWFGDSAVYGLFAQPLAAHVAAKDSIPQLMRLSSVELLEGERRFYAVDDHIWDMFSDILRNAPEYLGERDNFPVDIADDGKGIEIEFSAQILASHFEKYFGWLPDIEAVNRIELRAIGDYILIYIENVLEGRLYKTQGSLYKILQGLNDKLVPVQVSLQSPVPSFMLATVEPFIAFLFPNPNAIVSSNINQIYTYRDNMRVVRYLPSNVFEYRFELNSGRGETDFAGSLLLALSMIERDRENLLELDHIMPSIRLVGFDIAENGFTFYFNYVLGGIPVHIYPDFAEGIRQSHAIIVTVRDGRVAHYRRLNIVFFAERKIPAEYLQGDYIINSEGVTYEYRED